MQRELREAVERQRRRHAEQALLESEARLQAIMDNVGEGIITISGDGAIESMNLAAQTLFGYEAPEAIGRRFTMLLCEPHASEYREHLGAYLAASVGRVIGFGPRPVMGRHKDRTAFPLDLAISEMPLPFAGESLPRAESKG